MISNNENRWNLIYFYILIAFVKWIFYNDSWIFCSLHQFVNCLIIIICHFPFSFINSSAFIDLLGANKYSLFNIKCIKWFILTVRQINLGVKKGETHSLIDMNIPPNKWLTHAPFTCFNSLIVCSSSPSVIVCVKFVVCTIKNHTPSHICTKV